MLMRFFALANLRMRRPSSLPSITLLSIICSAFACGLLASEAHAQGGPPPRNQPPIAIISYTSSAENPLQFHFDSSQSSDDVGIVSRRFQIENTWVTAEQLTHTFTSFSKHRVKLEVVDGQNRRATADVEIDLTDLSHLVADEVLRPYESLSSSLSAQTIHTLPLQLRAGPARINLKNADGEAHAQQNCAPLEGLEYLACEAQNLIDQAYVDNFRVDSAQVFLNGKKVLGPLTDLQATLSGPVALTGNDVLEIRIEGPVTSYLQLEIQSLEVNLAPQASFIVAPPPKGVPALVLIDASSSTDPNDQVVAYRAEIQPDNIVTEFQASPHFELTVPTAGQKFVSITVRDKFGLTASLTQDLTLIENLPPTVLARWGQTTSQAPFQVQFRATGSDPDDPANQLLYNFIFPDQTSSGFTLSATASKVFPTAGTYFVIVQVKDPGGLVAEVNVPVLVQNNLLPVAQFNIQPRNDYAPATLSFDASPSFDPDGAAETAALDFRWDFGDGQSAEGKTLQHTFVDPGEYAVRLFATDPRGGMGILGRIVFAWSSAPPTPRLSVTPNIGPIPLQVTFNAQASTPGDTPIARYVIITGDGNTLESTTPIIQHTYTTPNIYSATLKVYDQDGDGNLIAQSIRAFNGQKPIAFAEKLSEDVIIPASFTLTAVNSTSPNPSAQITTYSWTLPNGELRTGPTISFTTHIEGIQYVRLQVTDNYGIQSDPVNFPIAAAMGLPPLAIVQSAKSRYRVGQTALFDGSSSWTPNGTAQIVEHKWFLPNGSVALGAQTQLLLSEPGNFTVGLEVTDSKGYKSPRANFPIIVEDIQPPTAVIQYALSSAYSPTALSLDGTQSQTTNLDAEIQGYEWRVDGPNGISIPAFGPNPSMHLHVVGQYSIHLRVFDTAGGTSPWVSVSGIEVRENQKPIARISLLQQTLILPDPILADAFTSSDPDGHMITQYHWSLSDGQTSQGAIANFNAGLPGLYALTLQVTDELGLMSDPVYQVIELRANQPPIAVIQFEVLENPLDQVSLSGLSSTDADGQVTNYRWLANEIEFAQTPEASFIASTEGHYAIRLEVTDDRGATNSSAIGPIYLNPANFTAPEPIYQVDLESSLKYRFFIENPNSRLTYVWKETGSVIGTGIELIHEFSEPGSRNVTLEYSIESRQLGSISIPVDVDIESRIKVALKSTEFTIADDETELIQSNLVPESYKLNSPPAEPRRLVVDFPNLSQSHETRIQLADYGTQLPNDHIIRVLPEQAHEGVAEVFSGKNRIRAQKFEVLGSGQCVIESSEDGDDSETESVCVNLGGGLMGLPAEGTRLIDLPEASEPWEIDSVGLKVGEDYIPSPSGIEVIDGQLKLDLSGIAGALANQRQPASLEVRLTSEGKSFIVTDPFIRPGGNTLTYNFTGQSTATLIDPWTGSIVTINPELGQITLPNGVYNLAVSENESAAPQTETVSLSGQATEELPIPQPNPTPAEPISVTNQTPLIRFGREVSGPGYVTLKKNFDTVPLNEPKYVVPETAQLNSQSTIQVLQSNNLLNNPSQPDKIQIRCTTHEPSSNLPPPSFDKLRLARTINIIERARKALDEEYAPIFQQVCTEFQLNCTPPATGNLFTDLRPSWVRFACEFNVSTSEVARECQRNRAQYIALATQSYEHREKYNGAENQLPQEDHDLTASYVPAGDPARLQWGYVEANVNLPTGFVTPDPYLFRGAFNQSRNYALAVYVSTKANPTAPCKSQKPQTKVFSSLSGSIENTRYLEFNWPSNACNIRLDISPVINSRGSDYFKYDVFADSPISLQNDYTASCSVTSAPVVKVTSVELPFDVNGLNLPGPGPSPSPSVNSGKILVVGSPSNAPFNVFNLGDAIAAAGNLWKAADLLAKSSFKTSNASPFKYGFSPTAGTYHSNLINKKYAFTQISQLFFQRSSDLNITVAGWQKPKADEFGDSPHPLIPVNFDTEAKSTATGKRNALWSILEGIPNSPYTPDAQHSFAEEPINTATNITETSNPFTHTLLVKVAKPQNIQITSLRLQFESPSLTPNSQDISVGTLVAQTTQEAHFQLRVPVSRMSRLSNEVASQFDVQAGQAPQDATLKMQLVAIDQGGVEYPLVNSNVGVGLNARYLNFRSGEFNEGSVAGSRGHFIVRNRGALALVKLKNLTPPGAKFRFNDGAMLFGGRSPDHKGHESGLKFDFYSLDPNDTPSGALYERATINSQSTYSTAFGEDIRSKYKDVALIMLAASVGWMKNEEPIENVPSLQWDRDCLNRESAACNFTLDDCVFTNTLPMPNSNTGAGVVQSQILRCQVIRNELAASIQSIGNLGALPRLYAAVDRLADWSQKNNNWLHDFQTEIAPYAAGVYLRYSFGDNVKMHELITTYAQAEVATEVGQKYAPRNKIGMTNETVFEFHPEQEYAQYFADVSNPSRRAIYLSLVDDWNVRLLTDGRIVLRNEYTYDILIPNTDRPLQHMKSFDSRVDRRTSRDYLVLRRSNGDRLSLKPISPLLTNEAADHFNHFHLEIDSRRPDGGGLP